MSFEKPLPNLFSVVILHYNQPATWACTVQSVLDQDYPAIQLIFADDSTPGFNPQEVSDYIEKAAKENLVGFQILCREKNLGTTQSLSDAYRYCDGTFVTQIAADDSLATPQTISQFAAALQTLPRDACGICGISYLCDAALNKTGTVSMSCSDMEYINTLNAEQLFEKLAHGCIFHLGATAFLKKRLAAFLPLNPKYRLVEDWPLFFEIAMKGSRVVFSYFPATLYRGSGGVTDPANKTKNRIQFYKDHFSIMEDYVFCRLNSLSFLSQGTFLIGYWANLFWGDAKSYKEYAYHHTGLFFQKMPAMLWAFLYLCFRKVKTMGRDKYV